MTLRRQLLLVSLLLLSLPWAGCQFIREMEGAMRQGQENALQATAQAIATVAQTQGGSLFTATDVNTIDTLEDTGLYAFPSNGPVIVDGYDDGWEGVGGITFTSTEDRDFRITARARSRDSQLYLLLEISDAEVQYYNPGLQDTFYGDRLLLRLGTDQRPRDYVVATAAPGKVRARPASRTARSDEAASIRGYWQDAKDGYTLELELPLALTGNHLGLAVISATGEAEHHTGSIDPGARTSAPRLVTSPPAARELLAPFASNGRQLILLDSEGWVLADQSVPELARAGHDNTFWLLRLLYRSILQQDSLPEPPQAPRPGKLSGTEVEAALAGNASNQRYQHPLYSARTLNSSAVPVAADNSIVGAIVIRESGETYLSLTDHAFSRLLGYSLITMAATALGLLGYASVLSWRIRRLSRAVNSAIAEDGSVHDGFASSRARDEIGDLSRHYDGLLRRVREYNDYLRTLSRKLSHELRTPIAVIQSSLDNLEHATGTDAGEGNDDGAQYRDRAREGLSRLQRILAAMSEATNLEESIRADALAATDLVPVLESVWGSYRDLYKDHGFTATIAPDTAIALASPDLLVQALDKIVDNAVSFYPPGGNIHLELAAAGNNWKISIANDGPVLPTDKLEQLFDPMVSLRESSGERVHLGLGLHIVRLVTEFHRGIVKANNRADSGGVIVSLELPRAD